MNTLIIHTQLLGNGGIPRFNRNFNTAIANAKVLSLNDDKPFGSKKNKIRFLGRICYYLIRFRPSIVIIGHLNFAPIALLVRLLSGAKCIVLLHGIEAWEERKRLKWCYRYIDEFWAVSNYTSRLFVNTNNVNEVKLKTIFNTLPSDWPIKKGVYKSFFFSVARLDTSEGYKGIDLTINAVAQLQVLLRKENFQYIIVANGDDVQRHKTMVSDLKIEDIVVFKSNVTDDELQQLYKDCSFFILPSTGEGFGIVYLEAMACGKACVGAYGCGAEDVIADGVTGYLLKPSIEAISNTIRTLISDKELLERMGKAGLLRLKAKFIYSRFQERIEKLLEVE